MVLEDVMRTSYTYDCIIIKELQVFANHGVLQEEKENGQNFYVNAVLETNTKPAGINDDLTLSTNYATVCSVITECLQNQTFDLIEAAAEYTAEQILLQFPLVHGITLELRKPEAPIPLPFSSVSVSIHRQWNRSYIAVGSNMGDTRAHVQYALDVMAADPKCRMGKVSTLIESTPYGGVEQDIFLNGVFFIDTLYTPEELLERLHEIEAERDRTREVHWGPRTLDLDILLYQDLIIDNFDLKIPHVDMLNRDFVMGPLAEIAPYEMHPIAGKCMMELAKAVKEIHVIV